EQLARADALPPAAALPRARRPTHHPRYLGDRPTLHVDEHHRHPLLDAEEGECLVDGQPGDDAARVVARGGLALAPRLGGPEPIAPSAVDADVDGDAAEPRAHRCL